MADPRVTGDERDRAVEVLQRLLTDQEFRQTFRRSPAAACLEAGLDDAAAEFSTGGAALHTLEMRESKSSLAGVLMAAAAEGAGVFEFAEHAHSSLSGDMGSLAREALDRAGVQQHAQAVPGVEHLLGQQTPQAPPTPAVGAAPDLAGDAAAAMEHGNLDAGQHVVHIASKYVGTPYVWGGESPSGFDCSGLVQYCFRQVGVHLDRTTWDQVKEGHAVEWGHFQPGDLIFSNFEGPGAGATHVVIYAGHGQVIAAPHTGGHVEYEPVDWFKPYFMGARRVVPDQTGGVGMGTPDLAASGHPGGSSGTMGMSAVAGNPQSPAAAPAPSGGGAGVGANTLGAVHAVGGDAVHEAAGGLMGMIGPYPGDNASRGAIAHWMADAARKAGLPPELPVMAALVESGLKNDRFGDRDSLGFFQMRTSIWDHGKYAGFPHDPRLQLRWFLDEARGIKSMRSAGFGGDPHGWGDWIADVERPAAQYRGRYQLQLETARQLLRG